eukprot:CAMPEP_0119107278 /NCGR_PEP_ID=MMETSP1180-20130426/9613_1 /TAXON_ID=3052 ORGANISM="Chlamydomonas cf sp, Strain CCMP681" /NCGR_SAMPLE_ID=MMETSP1180 /ASSEMBLY_ACC=CAM_ASM_000741 /LENGTH=71 /DNA_ID=CAMNT_0007092743 /DNA_START=919 /DNA_END=1134 /DNA_ORIENTATION=-
MHAALAIARLAEFSVVTGEGNGGDGARVRDSGTHMASSPDVEMDVRSLRASICGVVSLQVEGYCLAIGMEG